MVHLQGGWRVTASKRHVSSAVVVTCSIMKYYIYQYSNSLLACLGHLLFIAIVLPILVAIAAVNIRKQKESHRSEGRSPLQQQLSYYY